MPTALETLIKILKQERESGCDNRTVIGGLSGYGDNWYKQAKDQARRAEHLVLADELLNILKSYDGIENRAERLKQINYMLDRITGRVPMPPQYQNHLETIRQTFVPPTESSNKNAKLKPPRPAVQERTETPSPIASARDTRRKDAPQQEVKPDRPQKRNNEKDFPRKDTRPDRRPPKIASRRLNDDDDDDGNPEEMPLYDAMEIDLRHVGKSELDVKPLPRLARPPRTKRTHLDPQEAEGRLADLYRPVTDLKGVGHKIAEQLEPLGITTVQDMIHYLPKRFDDYTRLLYISRLTEGQVATVVATVKFAQVKIGQGGRKDFFCTLEDGTGKLNVTFFGMHYLSSKIRVNEQIVVSGKVSLFRNLLQMSNPEWEHIDSENLHTIGLVPVYKLGEGVKPRQFRRTMKQAIEAWSERIPDYVPLSTLERSDLADIGWTVRNLHFPEGNDHLHHARRRYVFDQLLLMQLSILGNRREWQGVPADEIPVSDGFLDEFVRSVFPYPLTRAQERAIADIRRDIARPVPMNRLIQGDVGSGKTAVAIAAMAMAVQAGNQAALMSPTSILAEQHYRVIQRLFENYPAEQKPVVGLLTSALSSSEREAIYRGLADGSIDIVVGTHALIQGGVAFNRLGVAIIDEQHRFGVGQRAALRSKGKNPHLLVMTATPIPRTLALTLYADLDLSIIDEKPAGRLPIKTRVHLPSQRYKLYEFMEMHLELGRQAFIINPLVEPSEKIDARSATEAYEELTQYFHKYRVCLLHGRMKPSEKDEIMGAFARHEYDIMATTTVAEVGVDVPNANIILIDGANRFGLAQLHQLRGRVGRGEHQSFCMLMVEEGVFAPEQLLDNNVTPEKRELWDDTQKRVFAMVDTDDGFKLAELDWQLRGAGDLLGTRQSGAMMFVLEEYITPEIAALAQREARTLYDEDSTLSLPEHWLLQKRVAMLKQDNGDVS